MKLPGKGEEVSLPQIKEICEFYGLHDLWTKIETRSQDIVVQLRERGEDLLRQVNEARTIDECLRFAERALSHLGAARGLLPEDSQIEGLHSDAITEKEYAQDAKGSLEEADRLLDQRDEFGLESQSDERIRRAREILEQKPGDLMKRAVKGMLPKTKLGRAMLTKLKIHAGPCPEHGYVAQKAEKLDL